MQNYYNLLGVSQDTEIAKIKEVTQGKIIHLREKLVEIQDHPQQAEIKELILEELQQIKTAYTVLSDPQQRQRYDSQLNLTEEPLVKDDETEIFISQPLVSKESLASSPYQPPAAAVFDLNDETELELAARGSRLSAYLIDNLIMMVPIILFLIIAIDFRAMAELMNAQGGSASSAEQALQTEMMKAMGGTFSLVLGLSYFMIFIANLMLLYRNGQTIGKYLLAIKIVKVDGSRAGLARIILLRTILFSFVSLIPLIGQVIYYLIDPLFIFHSSRRCLHDLVAGTIVIKAK